MDFHKRGVRITKSSITNQLMDKIRSDLKVVPFTLPSSMQEKRPFYAYRESPKYFYVPRMYAIKELGFVWTPCNIAKSNKRLEFNGGLRDYQTDIVNTYIEKSKITGCGLLEIPCGRGKCLGKNTLVLMHDGSTKFVQHVQNGDIVVGDHGEPRIVSGVTKGIANMFRISQYYAMDYIVNDEHIMTIWDTAENQMVDIPIKELFELQRKNIRFSQIKGVRFDMKTKTHILTSFSIHQTEGLDYYYGFCVDGNHRFLLGDGTVTHNTVMALNIIGLMKVKTLVIVHKEFLMNQWIERIQQFLPNAKVGKIQGKIINVADSDIVIGMLQSLSMKTYDDDIFNSFGLTVVDECHHIAAEVFSNALFKIVTPYMLGLSATMERKDKLSYVFKLFLGDIIYTEKQSTTDKVTVRSLQYEDYDNKEYSKVELNFKGHVHYSRMIKKICENKKRTDLIIQILGDLLKECPSQQIMVLAHNKSILTYLYNKIETDGVGTVGYYIGGMKEVKLKESEGKQIIIATYAMAEEALDIKTLSALILATPKTDVNQAVGRILRMKHEKPIVVDIVDQHDIFKRQWASRRRFYKKCNYQIDEIHCESYNGTFENWTTIYQKGKKVNINTIDEKKTNCVLDSNECLIRV